MNGLWKASSTPIIFDYGRYHFEDNVGANEFPFKSDLIVKDDDYKS
jgi:hypothetical protein